jgi:hypothetical protein
LLVLWIPAHLPKNGRLKKNCPRGPLPSPLSVRYATVLNGRLFADSVVSFAQFFARTLVTSKPIRDILSRAGIA